MRISSLPAVVCLATVVSVTPASGATIQVPPGGDVQQAVSAAQPGDVIALTAGAVYAGPITLTPKSGNAPITIRTAADAGLPADGARISPANAAALAAIQQNGNAPAIQTTAGAHHWRLMLLEIRGNGTNDIVTLGDGSGAQPAAAQIPHDLVVDRVYLHGDAVRGQKRGIALNSASTAITGSWISDIKAVGQDSQAIAGWNGPGPFAITNNYLEASGENVMFGGADPSVPGLVPSDITLAGNQFFKQPSWRDEKWSVKNLLELKNARRVAILRNTFDYNWQGGQSGYAILFTVRNQDGHCPWCQVDHVTFEGNAVRHAAAGVQILGYDNNHPSQQAQAITIRNNLFADIDSVNWGGNGYFLALIGGARDVTVDHNTIISDHGSGIATMDGPPVLGFTFTNNLAKHNLYGFIGTGRGVGADSISAFLPGSVISRNAIAGGTESRYPGDNTYPSVAQFESQFAGYATGDYRLVAASPWRGAATDGRDLGVFAADAALPPPSASPEQPIAGEGVITGPVHRTSCPGLQFTIARFRVAVDSGTQFGRARCKDLAIGTRIRAVGIIAPDGTLRLSQVTIVGREATAPADAVGVAPVARPRNDRR
jgi:hypothetical protein